ncbi:MAG TPA: hypothetical protein VHE12_03435 [bacterium]|nr:hypothetical protein [bacterium]
MNTFLRNASFVALLALSAALLPACGSKSNVQSDKAPETVLNPETTPTVETSVSTGDENGTSIRTHVQKSYTAKIHRTKGPNSTTTVVTTPTDATPVITPAATQNTAPMESTPAPVKKSSGPHWFLWFLVLVVLGGIGWYFWQKNQEDFTNQSPKPPTGGLSPVSGFTAVRSSIDNEEKKPSIWTRKLF